MQASWQRNPSPSTGQYEELMWAGGAPCASAALKLSCCQGSFSTNYCMHIHTYDVLYIHTLGKGGVAPRRCCKSRPFGAFVRVLYVCLASQSLQHCDTVVCEMLASPSRRDRVWLFLLPSASSDLSLPARVNCEPCVYSTSKD